MRTVRSKRTLTAYYGFGDASGAGFGATLERPGGVHGQYGLWGKDSENQSSNYRELRNLVETVEEEARVGYLNHGELWIFTDNSTAESCFFQGRLLVKAAAWVGVEVTKGRNGPWLHSPCGTCGGYTDD